MATGYGLLERETAGSAVLAVGVITTTTDLAFEARLRIIYDGVHDLLVKHTPDLIVLEDLYSEYKFPRTALLMAHARGVVCLAAGQWGVPVMSLAPAEVKSAVAFNGAASKVQVQRAMGRLRSAARDSSHPIGSQYNIVRTFFLPVLSGRQAFIGGGSHGPRISPPPQF